VLSYLFKQFISSCGIFFRTIRAFFTRKVAGFSAYLRRVTNFSRKATKVATDSFQGAATAIKKPTKREDYVETRRLFISKSFLILGAITLILLALLIYFVVWPFLLSHFFTARFYQKDSRVETWSGKVIVCYDEKKKKPMYKGTLKEGVLQGKGSQYDEDGLLTFEGTFLDGMYDSNGILYDKGVMIYQGEFKNGLKDGSGTSYSDGAVVYRGQYAQDLYEGSGTLYQDSSMIYEGGFSGGKYNGSGTVYKDGKILYQGQLKDGVYEGAGDLYEDGELCYRGAFAAGVFNGAGTAYQNGALAYEGTFVDGLYDGDGTEYYSDGKTVRYKGAFAAGQYEGEGESYDDSGRLVYKGSFSAGLYDGDGTLYLSDGDSIESEFKAGEPNGSIKWYKARKLWYDGGSAGLVPNGFGTIYSPAGKVVYAGQMDNGTIDGGWLLTLTADQAREAFGEADMKETDNGRGFLITNEYLDLSVLCTYQQEDQEPQVYEAYFHPAGDQMSLMPWEDELSFMNWAEDKGDSTLSEYTVETSDQQTWHKIAFAYQDYTLTGVSLTEGGAILRLNWERPSPTSSAGNDDETLSESQDRLADLMKGLDQISSGGADKTGTGIVETILSKAKTPADAEALMDAMCRFAAADTMANAMDQSCQLAEKMLQEEKTLLEQEQSDQETVDAWQERVDTDKLRLMQYQAAKEQARITIKKLAKTDAQDEDLQAAMLLFDPVTLDMSGMYDAAISYAQAVAAGKTVDTDELQANLKLSAIDLALLYEDVTKAQKEAEKAAEALSDATIDYSRGNADKSQLYLAQLDQNEAIISLISSMQTFTQKANTINTVTGGWIADSQDWFKSTFEQIFAQAKAAAAMQIETETETETQNGQEAGQNG
jgi:hypothetical protein